MKGIHLRTLALASLVALGLAPAMRANVPAEAAPFPPIQLTSSGTVTMQGSLLPNLARAARIGPLAAGTELGIGVSLRLRDPQGLDATIAQISTPGSPLYHHYLSVSQFAARFGPTPAQREAVAAWLRSQGLRVTSPFGDGLAIEAHGTVSSVDRAFGVDMTTYRGAGHTFFANARPVQVPASLASSVEAVVGLTNRDALVRAPLLEKRLSDNFNGYSPQAVAQMYDVTPLWNAGANGTGKTVAIVGGGISASDISSYDSEFGLSDTGWYDLVSVKDPNADGKLPVDSEYEMDMEIVHGIAPGAHLLMYQDASERLDGIYYTFLQIVSENRAQVVSTSVDGPEEAFPPALVSAMHDVFREAAVQGQTVFAASGDQAAFGASDGQGNETTKLEVHYPCSDIYVTCVGGTSLQQNADGSYGGESVWADGSDPSNPTGSTGGLSGLFNRMPWQTGPGTDNQYSQGNHDRMVPDVSANADPNTGFALWTTDRSGSGQSVIGGTSAASPWWAGLTAILEQNLGTQVGYFNPTLYALGTQASTLQYNPFHDITQGNNLYYPATPGYDLATGWGSPDATALADDIHQLGMVRTPIITVTGTDVTHKVGSAFKKTKTLKVKETGYFHVYYGVTYLNGQTAGATLTIYKGTKSVAQFPMTASADSAGHTIFYKPLTFTKKGSYTAEYQVTVGQYANVADLSFKVK